MLAAPKKRSSKKKLQSKPLLPKKIRGEKYLWNVTLFDDQEARTIAYNHNISLPVAKLLCARGFTTPEQIRAFLMCSYDEKLFHPSKLKDAEVAADRIIKAINDKEKILVFGDYDVDGVTSSSVMLAALIPLGANINYHLPHREREGYGLSQKAVEKAARCGYKLIVTVDNGITAIEPAKDAKRLGIDLIITDHHRPHAQLPDALCIINPNQEDCPYPFKGFAGVGVIFKLMCLIYEKLGIEKLPPKIYELLMLGTIADVVPLLSENRHWVRQGLTGINKNRSSAMAALIQNSGLDKERLDSLDIGFMIAPQINALGRLDDSREAVRFMISSESEEVLRIGKILKSMNEERKKIDREIYDEIDAAIQSKQINLEHENVIIAASPNWPAGVIGLVAGKLMHNYGKPAILLHLDKKGFAKGSCRSIPEFNIFDALNENKDLIENFGGHSCAAGLKLSQENIARLKENLEKRILTLIDPQELRPKITVDATLELPEINQKFMHDLAQLEPFGNSNPQPAFLVHGVTQLKAPQLLKDKHVKCTVFSEGIIKPVIFFNRPELYPKLKALEDQPFDLACHVIKNEWGGSVKIELLGLDVML